MANLELLAEASGSKGTDVIDFNAGVTAAAGLLGAALAAVNVAGLLRLHLRQRARLRVERERSARHLARTTGFVQMVDHAHTPVRFVERDADGERLIEIGRRAGSDEMAA